MAVPEQAGSVDLSQATDKALTHLYAAHWRSLVRLSWLLVGDQPQAEKTAQDAFVAVHARWSELRDQDLALAYLRRAVVNGSRSVPRNRKVEDRPLTAQKSTLTAHATISAPTDQDTLDGTAGAQLVAALELLPRRQHEVLVLRYYLDLSEAQIADALSISASAVRTHSSRGLIALRTGAEADMALRTGAEADIALRTGAEADQDG